MQVVELREQDIETYLDLRADLWKHNTREQHAAQLANIRATGKLDGYPHISDYSFAMLWNNAEPAGLVEYALRAWADCCASSPVAYIEGLYVCPAYRRQGLVGQLLQHVESWARAKGCKEIHSDTQHDNQISVAAHTKHGFQRIRPIICFKKLL